ncbi:MAG: class B sortase [Clostridia bacterium]|nr:class B sortase [Clostridia bacterium]
MKLRKIIRVTLFCLFAAVFCISAYKLIEVRLAYRENEEIYSEAIDQFVVYLSATEPPVSVTTAATTSSTSAATTAEPDQSTATTTPPTATSHEPTVETSATEPTTEATIAEPIAVSPDFVLDWAGLKAVNPDIVAWIWQSGTTINYPVLKSDTNDEYLYTTYNFKYSKLGSIFLDWRSSLDAKNPVIYGHNAGNGMMFATLVKYRGWEYFNQNRYFYIMTEDGTAKYEIFSAYKVKTFSDTYTFAFDDESYADYIQRILTRSAYKMGVSVSAEDEIITLSTCTNTGDEDRFVVHAKRIEG